MAGTSDGKALALSLQEKGFPVLVTVTSAYGEDLALEKGLRVLKGPLDTEALLKVITEASVRVLVDGTHPYAVQASLNAMEAAERAGISYMRFDRPVSNAEEPFIQVFSTLESLCQGVEQEPGNVLLTLGSNHLQHFAGLSNRDNLYIRMLPVPGLLEKALGLGFRGDRILAMQGPFSEDFNTALIRQWDISLLVTKDSAGPGGYAEKVEAARRTHTRIFLLSRPDIAYPEVYTSSSQLINKLEKLLVQGAE